MQTIRNIYLTNLKNFSNAIKRTVMVVLLELMIRWYRMSSATRLWIPQFRRGINKVSASSFKEESAIYKTLLKITGCQSIVEQDTFYLNISKPVRASGMLIPPVEANGSTEANIHDYIRYLSCLKMNLRSKTKDYIDSCIEDYLNSKLEISCDQYAHLIAYYSRVGRKDRVQSLYEKGLKSNIPLNMNIFNAVIMHLLRKEGVIGKKETEKVLTTAYENDLIPNESTLWILFDYFSPKGQEQIMSIIEKYNLPKRSYAILLLESMKRKHPKIVMNWIRKNEVTVDSDVLEKVIKCCITNKKVHLALDYFITNANRTMDLENSVYLMVSYLIGYSKVDASVCLVNYVAKNYHQNLISPYLTLANFMTKPYSFDLVHDWETLAKYFVFKCQGQLVKEVKRKLSETALKNNIKLEVGSLKPGQLNTFNELDSITWQQGISLHYENMDFATQTILNKHFIRKAVDKKKQEI